MGHFLVQNNHGLALAKRPAAQGVFQHLCAPTARRRKTPFFTDETMFHNSLTTSTLCILPCSRCSVPNSEGNLHRTRAKNAEIRSKISKKVRYHLQSFELGPHRSNWRKKPPRTGRFLIIDANNNRKKKRRSRFNEETNHGGPAAEKKSSARAEDRKPSHPNTDQMSEHNAEARKATPQKTQNPSERLRMNPCGSNRWRTIEF